MKSTRVPLACTLLLTWPMLFPSAAVSQDFTWGLDGGGEFTDNQSWAGFFAPSGVVGSITIQPKFGGDVNFLETTPSDQVFPTNFTIGSSLGTTSLLLDNLIAASIQSTVQSRGRIEVRSNGHFLSEQNVLNQGEIETIGPSSKLTGATITNSGVIRGDGEINGDVTNTGRIESFGIEDDDVVETRTFRDALTNGSGGLIAIRHRDMRVVGGLENQGALSGDGDVNIFTDVNNTGAIGVSSGSEMFVVGNIIQNGDVNLPFGSKLVVFGDFTGTGGTTGLGILEVLGAMSVGASPAEVHFGGSLVVGGGAETLIELGGLNTGEFDRLVVNELTSLGGDLNVELIDDFTLGLGQTFEIIETGDLIGEFSGLSEGALVGEFGGIDLFITYTAGDGDNVALFTAPLSGDYNGDGIVDAADYAVWLGALGQTGITPFTGADGNGDGDVTIADYGVWKQNIGNSAGSGSGFKESVPEPASWLLCAVMGVCWIAVRRK